MPLLKPPQIYPISQGSNSLSHNYFQPRAFTSDDGIDKRLAFDHEMNSDRQVHPF
jgi:hypothetical protein